MKDILIQLRTENRYSQNKLAKELGISRQAYIKYESGEVEPSVEIVRKLSKIYNVSCDYLICNCETIQNPVDRIKLLNHEQKKIVFSLIDSLFHLDLHAIQTQKTKRTLGGIGKVWMSDDFDAPLEEFKEYM